MLEGPLIVRHTDVQPPGSADEAGDSSSRTAEEKMLLCTSEQTLIGYLDMHRCYFELIILCAGLYVIPNLHVQAMLFV